MRRFIASFSILASALLFAATNAAPAGAITVLAQEGMPGVLRTHMSPAFVTGSTVCVNEFFYTAFQYPELVSVRLIRAADGVTMYNGKPQTYWTQQIGAKNAFSAQACFRNVKAGVVARVLFSNRKVAGNPTNYAIYGSYYVYKP